MVSDSLLGLPQPSSLLQELSAKASSLVCPFGKYFHIQQGQSHLKLYKLK